MEMASKQIHAMKFESEPILKTNAFIFLKQGNRLTIILTKTSQFTDFSKK